MKSRLTEALLNEAWGDRAFQLKKPMTFYVLIGLVPGNAYYGNSRLFDPVFKKVRVRPGSYLLSLTSLFVMTSPGGSLTMVHHDIPKPRFERDSSNLYVESWLDGMVQDGTLVELSDVPKRGSVTTGHNAPNLKEPPAGAKRVNDSYVVG